LVNAPWGSLSDVYDKPNPLEVALFSVPILKQWFKTGNDDQ
jgi:hypothetical protein